MLVAVQLAEQHFGRNARKLRANLSARALFVLVARQVVIASCRSRNLLDGEKQITQLEYLTTFILYSREHRYCL